MNRSVYDEILLEHNAHPQHKGVLPGANVRAELFNASCGDKIFVELKVEDGVIVDGKFGGMGCAIALAAADLMLGALIGKKVEQAERLRSQFERVIVGEMAVPKGRDWQELGAMSCVARMPARAECAKLAWRVMDELSERNR